MFKTRTTSSQVTVLGNPRIDFDYGELTKSAKLFLGKEKAERLIEAGFKNEKDFLILLAHMEHAARYYREHPEDEPLWEPKAEDIKDDEKDAPYYVPKRQGRALDPRATRQNYVNEFLQVVSLRTEKSYRLNLPYRLRSEAQHNTLVENRTEIIRDEQAKGTEREYRLRVHLCTKDLPKLITALKGDNTLSLAVSSYSPVPNKPMPVEVVWNDELPHRPEMVRQVLGRQSKALFEKGKDEVVRLARETRGAQIHLVGGNNCDATFEKNAKGEIQIKLDPKIELKNNPFQAFEAELQLMDYLSDQYSCSPTEFIESIPNITEALELDLENATRLWLEKDADENITEADKSTFLQEYAVVCLTLQNHPTPLGSISLNRMPEWKSIRTPDDKKGFERAKSSKDITEGFISALEREPQISPATDRALDGTAQKMKDMSFATISSVSPAAVGSKEWAEEIAKAQISIQVDEPQDEKSAQRYWKTIEATASALNMAPEELQRRRRLILENFYQVGAGSQLDAPSFKKAAFLGYSLSEEEREAFYLEREVYNQAEFESKGDKPLNPDGTPMVKPELQEFIKRHGTTQMEIPLNPTSLHRLTRYPTGLRSNGKDVAKAPYGSAKHMPRDRGQKSNLLQDLRIEDYLTKEAQEELKQKLSGDTDPKTLAKIQEIQKTISAWNRGHGLILSNRPTSPVDARTIQWAANLVRSKRENNLSEDKKCKNVGELYAIVTCLSRIGGMKVGGVDTPLLTQPLPSQSSTIPLQLLCGVNPAKIEELQEIHKNPILLRDMEARWENALKADIFNDPEISHEEDIIERISNADEPQRIILALEATLSEKPDFLQEFFESVQLGKQGLDALPKELNPYKGILPMLKSSPTTIRMGGEEMNLTSLVETITANLTDEEKELFSSFKTEENKSWENAVFIRAAKWKAQIEGAANSITDLSKEGNPLIPKGKENKVIDLPSQKEEEAITAVSSGLADALTAIEEESEKSGASHKKLLVSIAQALTNPEIQVLQVGPLTISKGPQGEVELTQDETQEISDPRDIELLTAAKDVATFLKGDPTNLSDEEKTLVSEIEKESRGVQIVRNSEALLETLQSVPDETAKASSFAKEFDAAKTKMAGLLTLDKSEKALLFNIKNWGYFEETHQGSIESAQVVFDFQREMESLTKKGFGTNSAMESLQKEFVAIYGDEARKVYLSEGEDKTKAYLTERTKEFFREHKVSLSKSATEIMGTISAGLRDLSTPIQTDGRVAKGSNPILEQAINHESGILHHICSLAETNRLVCKKLSEVQVLRKTTAERNKDKKDAPRLVPILSPALEKGAMEPTAFLPEGDSVKVNKVWAADWLRSPEGEKKLSNSLTSIRWASKESKPETKERLAFLQYLKAQGLQKEALRAMSNPQGREALEKGLTAYRKVLNTLHVNGTQKANTLVAANAAINQVDAQEILGKENFAAISKDYPEQEAKLTLKVSLEQVLPAEKTIRISSAFLENEEKEEMDKRLRKAPTAKTKSEKLRHIRGAAESLHQSETQEMSI